MANSEGEGLGYWLRWQVLVCALIFCIPAVVAVFLIFRVKSDPLSGKDLWMPCWRKLNPLWLLVYRVFAFVFMTLVLYQMVSVHGAFSFYFYTQWTFTLVIVYFALATIISAHGCWMYSTKPLTKNEERDEFLQMDLDDRKSTSIQTLRTNNATGTVMLQSHQDQKEIEQRAGFWGYLMLIIYQTCAGAVVLTDIVFWCLLVPFLSGEHFSLNLLMGSMHAVNAVFLLVDTALNNLPFPWFRMAYFVLWSCFYVAFQWVLHACGFTWWPYPFLELATPWAPLWYFCLALVHVPCYGLYVMLVKAKNLSCCRLFPHSYVRSY